MGELVYVGSCAGVFYAFDAATGEIRWSYDVSGDGASQFHGNPLILDSLVIVGTDEGSMEYGTAYAFERFSGKLYWKSAGHSGVGSNADFGGDSLFFFVTRDDTLLALSMFDGQPAWTFSTGWQGDDEREYADNMVIGGDSPGPFEATFIVAAGLKGVDG